MTPGSSVTNGVPASSHTAGTAGKAARKARRRAEIEVRSSMSPAGPAPDRLRVATWNLNSLRARLPGVERFIERVVRTSSACRRPRRPT